MLTFEEKARRLSKHEGILWTRHFDDGASTYVPTDPVVQKIVETIGDGEVMKLERPMAHPHSFANDNKREVIYVTRSGEKRLAFAYSPGAKIVKSLHRMVKRALK